MKKQIEIHQLLGLNKFQYLNYCTLEFNEWCESLSNIFYVPMRELQTNTTLWNWYAAKWDQKVVYPFLKENKAYIIAEIKEPGTYWSLFQDVVARMKSNKTFYPGPIVKKIRNDHFKNLQNQ